MCKNFCHLLIILAAGCANHSSESMVNNASSSARQPEIARQNRAPVNLLSGFYRATSVDTEDYVDLVAHYKNEYRSANDIDTKCDLLVSIAELDKTDPHFFIAALQDKAPRVRKEAAIQLRDMVYHKDVQHALIAALDESDDDVLIEVIEAVALIKTPVVHQKLTAISHNHHDTLIRQVAADYAQKMQKKKLR